MTRPRRCRAPQADSPPGRWRRPQTVASRRVRLFEDLARRKLGLKTVRRLQQRFNLPEDEAIRVAVEAVHEARREA